MTSLASTKTAPPEVGDRWRSLLSVTGAALLYFVSVLGCVWLMRSDNNAAAIWVADAIVLTLLIRWRPEEWGYAFAAVFLSGFVAHLLTGVTLPAAFGFSLSVMIELSVAVLAIRFLCGRNPQFGSDIGCYLKTQIVAALVAPGISTFLAAAIAHSAYGIDIVTTWRFWWSSAALGMMLVLPITLSATRERMRESLQGRGLVELVGLGTIAVGAVYLAMVETSYPFVIVGLVLSAVAMRLNPFATAWVSAFATLAIVAAATVATVPGITSEGQEFATTLHVFTALALVMPFAISLLIAQLRLDRARIAESELRFRTAMENAAIGMCLATPEGRPIAVNKAICQMLGFSEDELKVRTFPDLTHPDDRAENRALVNRVRNGEIDSYRVEKRYLRKDGSIMWGALAVSVIRDKATGAPLYFISQTEDITTRKAAEAELKASESRWSFALESAGQGVWDVDLRTGKSFHSRAWKSMLGYADHEIGSDVALWLAFVHPADLDRVQAVVRDHDEGRTDAIECEFRMRHKDGRWIWVLDRGRAIERDEQGRPLRVIGTHVDITAEKEAESHVRRMSRRMQLAVEAGNVGLWEFDPETGRIWWDSGIFRLYGVAPRDNVDAALFKRIVHPDDYDRVMRDVADAIEEGRSVDSQFRIIRQSGEIRHIRSKASLVNNANGAGRVLVGMNWDITENRQLTEALIEERERLRVTLETVADAVICTDSEARITFLNAAAKQWTTWSPDAAIGRPVDDVFPFRDAQTNASVAGPVAPCLRERAPSVSSTDVALIDRDGRRRVVRGMASPVRAASGNLIGAVLVIDHLDRVRPGNDAADIDEKSGLLNRIAFERSIGRACESLAPDVLRHALCILDIDGLDTIRDIGGDEARNAVVREIAGLVGENVRRGDVVARLGASQFGLILHDCTMAQAKAIAQAIVTIAGGQSYVWEERRIGIGMDAGIVAIEPGMSPDAAIRSAQAACGRARNQGGSRIVVDGPSERELTIVARAG